jgi:hypothetical protein
MLSEDLRMNSRIFSARTLTGTVFLLGLFFLESICTVSGDFRLFTASFAVANQPGDLDGNGDVDQNDLNIILAALNTPATGPGDPRDLDGDGMITGLDARKLIALCTRPRCAIK